MTHVYQVRVRAKPTKKHPFFRSWQNAEVQVLVRDTDGQLATVRAESLIAQRHWQVLQKYPLVRVEEARVRALGNEAWEQYQKALRGELVLMEFPEGSDLLSQNGHVFAPPVLDEDLFDEVLRRAGGNRITDLIQSPDEKNADYLLGETIFELKTLEENGLEKTSRQHRIAELFAPYAIDGNCFIDPTVLTSEELKRYYDVMGRPIQTHVKKAAKQIKATRQALGDDALKGGIIVLNTGYPALGHPEFSGQVARYVAKDTSSIHSIVCVSVWAETDGFELLVRTAFDPQVPVHQDVSSLQESYWSWFNDMMTDLMQGRIPHDQWSVTPSESMGFEVEGITYRWEPGLSVG